MTIKGLLASPSADMVDPVTMLQRVVCWRAGHWHDLWRKGRRAHFGAIMG